MSQALGVLEVRGMAALLGATDAMLKTAHVRICGLQGVGSGWVTVVVSGAVDAVEAAIQAGQVEAAKLGEVIGVQVIARAEAAGMAAMPHGRAVREAAAGVSALGLLETRGIMPLIAGADAMVKAAPVSLSGWSTIGGALAYVVVRGDVAAVQAALSMGRVAAEAAGEVFACLELPRPDAGVGPLLPQPVVVTPALTGGLGVLETTGYVGAVGGFDRLIKAANVSVSRLILGSGGRVGTLFTGDLDAVEAAVEAAEAGAKAAGVFQTCRVISRPSGDVLSCFAAGVSGGKTIGGNGAMGLIETRSTVAIVKAVDQMLKAADVVFDGNFKAGAFLTAGVIRGDVDAVRTALDVGAAEAAKYGELVSVHLIPNPLPDMETRLAHK